MLHDYVEFTTKNPSPVTLKPATHNSDATPKGVGYLHVPAPNKSGFHNKSDFLAVHTFYTPALCTTVLDEQDFIRAAKISPKRIQSEAITKFYNAGTFTYRASHKLVKSLDVVLHGILQNGKCYTFPLKPPATSESIHALLSVDEEFRQACDRATKLNIDIFQENEMNILWSELKQVPIEHRVIPFEEFICRSTPVNAIRQETEQLLWHQRLLTSQ